MQSSAIPISSYTPLRHDLHLFPSIPSSQPVISVNGLLNLWSVDPHILITISILSCPLTIPPNGLKTCQHSITLQPSFSLTMLSINLGFQNNWSLTMVDTLKMRYGVIYPLHCSNTNMHRLTTPKEISKLKMSTKSLILCFSGWWISTRPTGILCASLLCG